MQRKNYNLPFIKCYCFHDIQNLYEMNRKLILKISEMQTKINELETKINEKAPVIKQMPLPSPENSIINDFHLCQNSSYDNLD